MKINLDHIKINSSGEGELNSQARIASLLAEKLIRWQFSNPNKEIFIDGTAVEKLAHLAQLEAWTGLRLIKRKFSNQTLSKVKGGFPLACQQVSEMAPLIKKEWLNFYKNSESHDLEFLKKNFDVSVVIPCYKPSSFVEQFATNAKLWFKYVKEIIIVCDGNSPEDNELVSERLGDISNCVFFQREENRGPGSARNYGINQAKGSYVTFLDFDDCLDLELFLIFLQAATNSKKELFCSHLYKLPQENYFFAKRFSFPSILYQNQVAVNLMIKKDLIDDLPFDGPYNEKLIGHFEDWELNVALRLSGYKPNVLGLATYRYNIHNQGRQLSSVDTHWKSRMVLSRVYERLDVKLNPNKIIYLQNLLIQHLAQLKHKNIASNLFISRGISFLQRVHSILNKVPAGTFILKVISKTFQCFS